MAAHFPNLTEKTYIRAVLYNRRLLDKCAGALPTELYLALIWPSPLSFSSNVVYIDLLFFNVMLAYTALCSVVPRCAPLPPKTRTFCTTKV